VNLRRYQQEAVQTAQVNWRDSRKRHIPAFGVIGELGSLVSELKKTLRDGKAYTDGSQNLVEEFGDVLWYLCAIASHYELQLDTLIAEAKPPRPGKPPFGHIYAMVRTITPLTEAFESLPSTLTDVQRKRLARCVGAAGAATLQAIRQQKLKLSEILETNLRKVKGMFGPDTPGPARLFDSPKSPRYERLPRKLDIQFLERSRGGGRVEVIMRVDDINIGDRLTDNSFHDDGYRYHDAFHLAYAAVLGWSPVTRAIFRAKRKSDPRKDEAEDGARAIIIEEAIAHTVFNYALGHSMLRGLTRIDHNLLKFIGRMVRNLEVSACELHEWQRAILVGFEAFRELMANRGGWLLLDAENQSLTYSREGPSGR